MSIAIALVEVLKEAKANLIDVQIKELQNGLIGCTCSTGCGSDYREFESLESLVRYLTIIVDDWKLI
ncbi:hypothetical protein EJP02_021 [Escherichia phage EJP2]|nr:hypothetical protein EJP02_021 [Escherichia phage EJP2]